MKRISVIILFVVSLITLNAQTTYRIWVNNIDLPISNDGVLADVSIGGYSGGCIDSISFLFSGGFFLSGKSGDSLWANGQASASSIVDYRPGNVDSLYYDPKYSIYVVNKNDTPFGTSWLRWKFAVDLGADYYDGNNDGVYNPLDLNGNGVWDSNEDKPDLLGDITAWCVYNDGVPKEQRRYVNINPQGIEIHQTVFAFSNWQLLSSPVNNAIFIRYRLINRGIVVNKLDSVYFSAWTDTDIGLDYYTDLVGCDTILNAGYVYKDTVESHFGKNPPAHFIGLLQAPYAFIPGETFIDINLNGIFDEGVDVPLDTAHNYRGPLLGMQNILGAKNLNMSSFMHYLHAHPIHGDPSSAAEARNYTLGLTRNGIQINPCTWSFGNVFGGLNCNSINPFFLYSGDPVIQYGWINKSRDDQRSMTNTGPFQLFKDKPVDLIVAYIAVRGNNPLNSVAKTKNFTTGIKHFYNSNFTSFPTDIRESNKIEVKDFYLFQNYPNPFNPSTVISWQSPVGSHQTLKVYDVLGREIAALVNEYRPEGSYEVEFSTEGGLPSGVYIYALRVGDYFASRKMLLLK